jgi:hypothetical protein
MFRRIFTSFFTVIALAAFVQGQRAEVTLQLNEQFFAAMLDSVYQNFDPPAFRLNDNASGCGTLKILREASGMRTAVQFREGQIRLPLAFSGNYDPPFLGCVNFSGWADSIIDLEFDQSAQKVVGRARVTNVHLDGAGGVGSSVIAKMLQGTIDRRLNPIEILHLEKLTFGVPIPNTGTMRMRAIGIRHDLAGGVLNLHVTYEFGKG